MFGRRQTRVEDLAADLSRRLLEERQIADWNSQVRDLFKAPNSNDPASLNAAVEWLLVPVSKTDLSRAAAAATLVGALVERGAAPERPGAVILGRLPSILAAAAPAVQWLRERAIEYPAKHDFARAASTNPDATAAEQGVDALCLAAIACLSRSKELRRTMAQREALIRLAAGVSDVCRNADHLGCILRVLDDAELTVVQPSSSLGFVVRIVGVADNFQLHTLLAGAVIKPDVEGYLHGERPAPAVLAAATDGPIPLNATESGKFNLVGWDGTWIWNEGVPADIPTLANARIVRLEPMPYQRSWKAGRRFPSMPGSIEVVRKLDSEETAGWISKLQAVRMPFRAPEPQADI